MIPSWAVIGTADHAIPPAELLAMARQAHARITAAALLLALIDRRRGRRARDEAVRPCLA
jgi:hypothetical protein